MNLWTHHQMPLPILPVLISIIIIIVFVIGGVQGSGNTSSYASQKAIEDGILSSPTYSTTIRPIINQSEVMYIQVSFSLVAIASLDDVKQELVTNGFVMFFWKDEKISWKPPDYNGIMSIMPDPKKAWRPRMILINTLEDRDPFKDDYAHFTIHATGDIVWVPGGLFQTYCRLNMEKFPFDVQHCKIQLCPMSHTNLTLQFQPIGEMSRTFFFPNPGWDLLQSYVDVERVDVANSEFSCPTFHFELKRRPTTLVLNVCLPIVFLSFLNNLVFLIPVDSGEKISYAITVLLSLFVFLSMVSTLTPQKSDIVPALTKYLFILLASSVINAGLAIFTVFLHFKDEREEASIRAKVNFKHAIRKLMNVKRAVSPNQPELTPDYGKAMGPDTPPSPEGEGDCDGSSNKYRIISIHINKIFFIVMTTSWAIVTMWFFVFTNS